LFLLLFLWSGFGRCSFNRGSFDRLLFFRRGTFSSLRALSLRCFNGGDGALSLGLLNRCGLGALSLGLLNRCGLRALSLGLLNRCGLGALGLWLILSSDRFSSLEFLFDLLAIILHTGFRCLDLILINLLWSLSFLSSLSDLDRCSNFDGGSFFLGCLGLLLIFICNGCNDLFSHGSDLFDFLLLNSSFLNSRFLNSGLNGGGFLLLVFLGFDGNRLYECGFGASLQSGGEFSLLDVLLGLLLDLAVVLG